MKALLLEIKRLHGVLIQAHELAGGLAHADGLNRDYTVQRLVELLGEERAVVEPRRKAKGKSMRPEPEQHHSHISEHEERRQERQKRG